MAADPTMPSSVSSPAVKIGFVCVTLVLLGQSLNATESEASAVARGRILFTSGRHADGRPLVARTGESGVPLPAAYVACERCHGYDAAGKYEGGVSVSDIRWETLSKPYSLSRADGRERPPYDKRGLFVAVRTGQDPRGKPLASSMPRYELSEAEATDVIAYLESLRDPVNAGVTPTTIRLGLVMPPQHDPQTESRLALLRAWSKSINAQGGIFRRQVEWTVLDSPPSGQRLPILAALLLQGADVAFPARCERDGVPYLQLSASNLELGRFGFAFLPDTLERTLLLLRYVASQSNDAGTPVAVVHDPAFETSAIPARLGADGHRITVRDLPCTAATVPRLLATLRSEGIRHVVLAGPVPGFMAAAETSADDLAAAIYCTDGELPARRSSRLRLLGLRCATTADLAPTAVASLGPEWSANDFQDGDACDVLASAKLLEAALTDAGREVGREKLRDALEALRDVRTGFAPPAGFTPGRHIAAAGSYLVPFAESAEGSPPSWLPFGS